MATSHKKPRRHDKRSFGLKYYHHLAGPTGTLNADLPRNMYPQRFPDNEIAFDKEGLVSDDFEVEGMKLFIQV
jgi:hypothetical protein